MKKITLFALTLLAFVAPGLANPAEFAIKKVDFDLVATPEYTASSTISKPVNSQQKWVKVEVTFEATPDLTDELTFNYYVLFGDRLLVGHVNHVNIAKGRELHSVMLMSPRTVERITGGKPISKASITNISVTINKPGVSAPIAMGSLKPGARGEWWATMKQEEGYLVNKNDTPFAPQGWDYFEAVKTSPAR